VDIDKFVSLALKPQQLKKGEARPVTTIDQFDLGL